MKDEHFKFSVDNIIPLDNNTSYLRIIPDFSSEYFPPFHLRSIRVKDELLEWKFFRTIRPDAKDNVSEESFRGSVKQGGYYEIPRSLIREKRLFSSETIIDSQNDVFEKGLINSPYNESELKGRDMFEAEQGYTKLCYTGEKPLGDSIFLYCFNVGQGDSLLLILPDKCSYLIDVNIYHNDRLEDFKQMINNIMEAHELKGIQNLLITHKHLDHIRGAGSLVKCINFNFENLLINLDYIHPTKAVYEFLQEAQRIPNWINVNKTGKINYLSTKICIKNPSSNTRSAAVAPNINDSSICLCIRHYENLIYLTGDLSTEYFNIYNCKKNFHSNAVLKVSHHGSINGTDQNCLNILNPTYSFVSAGTSKKYNHPHPFVENILIPFNPVKSNQVKKYVRYEITPNNVIATPN